MAHTGLFGGSLSAGDIKHTDTSVYHGPTYVLKRSRWKPFAQTDIGPGEAQVFMDGIAAKAIAFYEKRGQVVNVGDYSFETAGARKLSLYKGSHLFLSLVQTHPGEDSRRGSISIQVDTPSADPKVDQDVKDLLRALGAKL